jgi:hypothetical protein
VTSQNITLLPLLRPSPDLQIPTPWRSFSTLSEEESPHGNSQNSSPPTTLSSTPETKDDAHPVRLVRRLPNTHTTRSRALRLLLIQRFPASFPTEPSPRHAHNFEPPSSSEQVVETDSRQRPSHSWVTVGPPRNSLKAGIRPFSRFGEVKRIFVHPADGRRTSTAFSVPYICRAAPWCAWARDHRFSETQDPRRGGQ